MGSIIIKPKKKIIDRTVIGWYFVIIFLTIIKYMEYEIAFMKTKKSPKLLIRKELPFDINITAPVRPKITPKNLVILYLSIEIDTEIKYTSKGVVIIIIEALIGDVKLRPSKNNNMFITTPKSEQKNK